MWKGISGRAYQEVEQDIFCGCAGICHYGQSFSSGGKDVSRK